MQKIERTVGRFEIIRRIGRGGMANVYLARQPGLEREVALKELASFHEEADWRLAQRFLHEARLAGSLNHPNIVTVYDYFEEDGTPYLAMEYMARGSLRPSVGRLTLAQVFGVLEGLLAALGKTGERGIVHRDLKPENLLISSEGAVKVADLGIAKAYTEVSLGLSATGLAIGTPSYMAPEQAMAQAVTPATDLYATGVIAYELLAGRVPFTGATTPLAVLLQHVNDPVPPLHTVRPELDSRLAEWIERLLAKRASDRPSSAAEAWEQLEEIATSMLGWRWRQQARLLETKPKPTRPDPPQLILADAEQANQLATTVPPAPEPGLRANRPPDQSQPRQAGASATHSARSVHSQMSIDSAAAPHPPTPAVQTTACPTCGRDWGARTLRCQSCRQVAGLPRGVRLSSAKRRLACWLLDVVLFTATLWVGWLLWALVAFAHGQTPAKQIMSMRTVRLRTRGQANWPTMCVRELIGKPLVAFASLLTFFLPLAWLLWDHNDQQLYDKLAGTIVVNDHDGQLV
jgi:serine/threonine protein kinase